VTSTYIETLRALEAAKTARLIVQEVQHRHPGSRPRCPESCELCRLLDEYDQLTGGTA
jgi:hypothetical protein